MRILLNGVLVDNQDKAEKFYTQKLGFVIKHNIPMGEFRWLTVTSKDNDDLELLLEPNQMQESQVFQKALYDKGVPAIALASDNIHEEYQKLKANGVQFKGEPVDAGGTMVATFDDTCGNWIQIYQLEK